MSNIKIIMQINVTYQNSEKTIDLPGGTQELTRDVFGAIEALEDVSRISIPNGILKIDDGAFENCTSLSSIDLPPSLQILGHYAFENCTSLSSIDLPPSLQILGHYAFENCTSLSSIDLPPSLTDLGNRAFAGCTSLASISLPPSLQILGYGAFRNCTRLSSISLPPSLKHIAGSAFESCTSLASIVLWPSLQILSHYAFKNCTSLKTILTSQALNQDIRAFLPQGVNVITIETLIPSLAGATPEQIGLVFSLIDLDRSSFDQPPTLRLREEALQQIPKATLIQTVFKPFLQKLDNSNNFLLPLVEELPLQDLAKFLATSKNPLQGILDAHARALSSNTIFGTDSENPDAGHKLDTPPFKPQH